MMKGHKAIGIRSTPRARPGVGERATHRRNRKRRWLARLLLVAVILSSIGFANSQEGRSGADPSTSGALSDDAAPGTLSSDDSDQPSPAAESLLRLGLKRAQQKRYREAELAFLRVTVLDPENPRAWNNLGVARRKQDKLVAAHEAYRKAIQLAPTFGLTYKNLAIVQERLGETLGALVSYHAYLRNRPNAADADAVQARIDWLQERQ